MKRRYIALLIPTISLLTSCMKSPLRSDIIDFIASFSIELAMQNYTHATYTREDISIENDVTSIIVKEMTINRDDLAYDYIEKTHEEDEETSSVHRYIEKREEKYFYITESEETERSKEQVNDLINNFFYTSSKEGIYTGGMFMGDAFREILPDIQDLVAIDSENKLLVYSYVNKMKGDNKEVVITQTVTLDKYGMLVKEDLEKTSDLGIFKTHIEVKKL